MFGCWETDDIMGLNRKPLNQELPEHVQVISGNFDKFLEGPYIGTTEIGSGCVYVDEDSQNHVPNDVNINSGHRENSVHLKFQLKKMSNFKFQVDKNRDAIAIDFDRLIILIPFKVIILKSWIYSLKLKKLCVITDCKGNRQIDLK